MRNPSLKSWISSRNVFCSNNMGRMGLYLGLLEGRALDNWRKNGVSCLQGLRWFTPGSLVLGFQCLYLESVPYQLYISFRF